MNHQKAVISSGVAHGAAMTSYIILVISLITNASLLFGENDPQTVFVPITMLTLLVFSVAVSGLLVFGRPVVLLIDNKRRDAAIHIASTLATLFVSLVCAIIYASTVK